MTTNESFLQSLEELKALYRANPDLPVPQYPILNIFLESRDQTIRVARILKTFSRDIEPDFFSMRYICGEDITLSFYTFKNLVCTKYVLGTRTVTRPIYFTATGPDETVEEEIVEWDCDCVELRQPVEWS